MGPEHVDGCPVCESVAPFGVADVEASVGLLLRDPDTSALTDLGRSWRQRAAKHLQRRLQRELGGQSVVSSEEVAIDVIKGLGRSLVTASQALDQAARQLADRGAGVHAANAKVAARVARDTGQQVLS